MVMMIGLIGLFITLLVGDSAQWLHSVVRRMVADIQERLTYLAQVYVLDSVCCYSR
jgi:hypothetical protein